MKSFVLSFRSLLVFGALLVSGISHAGGGSSTGSGGGESDEVVSARCLVKKSPTPEEITAFSYCGLSREMRTCVFRFGFPYEPQNFEYFLWAIRVCKGNIRIIVE